MPLYKKAAIFLLSLNLFLLVIWGISVNWRQRFVSLATEKDQVVATHLEEIANKEAALADADLQLEIFKNQAEQLDAKVAGLSTQLSDVSSELSSYKLNGKFPMVVPTSGEIVTFGGSYAGNMKGIQHFGIDIWSKRENNGMFANHRGNPVYAACSGRVVKVIPENGQVLIECDNISRDYFLPDYDDVITEYGHMGNGVTKELFFDLKVGQRVNRGEQIGTQGDLSSYFPEMRNVHLHFSIYKGKVTYPWNKNGGGPYNPCVYIGGNCGMVGQKFKALDNL